MTRALLVMLLAGCVAEPSHARLHLVNAVQGVDRLTVQLCPDDGDVCDEYEVPSESVSRWLELEPGTYEVRVRDRDTQLDTFRYGNGRGGRYALALYGIATVPPELGWKTRAHELLGGADEPTVAGFQLAHRMVDVRPPGPEEPAEVRLTNLAPGAQPVQGEVVGEGEPIELAPVPYAGVGDRVAVERDGRLELRFAGSPLTLASVELSPPMGSLTVVYVTGLEGDALRALVDRAD